MLSKTEDLGAELSPLLFRRRWWVVWALFGSTVINYINRQTLSVLAPVISQELHLSHTALSTIFGAFQISYAFAWLLGGMLIDIVGTRLGLSLAVIWWSAVSALTGFARSAVALIGMRFLLGIGEGFNWPGASKAVAECFPANERSLAVAIFDSGSSIGAVLAAICVPWIALKFGWRSAFLFSGILGIGWLIWWSAACPRQPSRELVRQKGFMGQYLRDWFPLLKKQETWAVVLGRSLSDPVWWFYVFWLPQYLSDVRGFGLKQIAFFAWIPFIAADLGNFAGGFAAKILIARGVPVLRTRKLICLVSSIPMLSAVPASLARTPFGALAFICVALFGYASFSTMGLTLPSDLFPAEVVGSVTGLSGLGAGLAGTVFTMAVGPLVDKYSYTPAFIAAALVPLLATAAIWFLVREHDAEGAAAP
jgi:ACS family hexuronate transporter-like MFS transporter